MIGVKSAHQAFTQKELLKHMFQTGKDKDANTERRKYRRSNYEAMVSHEILTDDKIHTGKMLNFSRGGIYFESDQVIYKGDEILLKVLMLSNRPDDYEQFPIDVEIIWVRELNRSAYKYGYGGKYVLVNDFLHAGNYSPDPQGRDFPEDRIENGEDPRSYPRKRLNQSLSVKYKDQTHKGFVRNISLGGALLETEGEFLLGTDIELVIPEGRLKNKSRVKARVVRFSPKGFAVSFAKSPARPNRSTKDRSTAKKPARKSTIPEKTKKTPRLSNELPFEF